MNAFFKVFSDFSVRTDLANGTVVTVKSLDSLAGVADLIDDVDELGIEKLAIHLPSDMLVCMIGELEHHQAFAPSHGWVKSLTVETDMMIETYELELLTGVQSLTLAIRRPKEGLGRLDSDEFISSFLSYIDPTADFEVVLFQTSMNGPNTRTKRVSPDIQIDIDRIDNIFAGFKTYKKCTFQRRLRRISEA